MSLPLLYSFRRCPYAIRARMAIWVSGSACVLREVVLKDKPQHMLAISPKGTVPVLQLSDGTVIDESLDVMLWALEKNDPEQWLSPYVGGQSVTLDLIRENDGDFKHHLDRYKYAHRYPGEESMAHRSAAEAFIAKLNCRLCNGAFLFGDAPSLIDFAIAPFIRQFANTDRAWFDKTSHEGVQRWLIWFLGSRPFTSVMQKYPKWVPDQAPIHFPSGVMAQRQDLDTGKSLG